MFRIVCVLVILGLYKYCNGTQTDEWKRHFYQPRRNYSNLIQNESWYMPKTSENIQSQVSITLLKPIIERQMNQSTETNIRVRQSLTQWRSNDSQNESTSRRKIREPFENNALKHNEIGLKNDQDSLRANINAKQKSLISFIPRNNRNSQLRNSVRAAYDAKQKDNLQIEYNQESQIFSDCCGVTSNVLFIRNSATKSINNGHNSFKGRDYLPPRDKPTIMYKAPEYLPPTERPYYTIKNVTNPFTKTTIAVSSTPAVNTKKPIVTQRPETNHDCSTCSSTSGSFYTPVTQPSTIYIYNISITILPSIFQTNTYKGEEYDPAKAMQVPAEAEEGMVNIIPLPPKNDQADKEIPREEGVELKANVPRNVTTTTTFRPVDRGDVSDEEESTSVAPAMVIPVVSDDQSTLTTDVASTQQMIYTSKIATTTTKMTLITTDHTTQTYIKKTTPFKGLEYLPPDNTTTIASPTTPQPLAQPAPAIAMLIPPEPEDIPPIPPPVTVETAPTTTVDISFMTPGNRYQTEANLPMNTSFTGPEYLPPKEPRIPTATASTATSEVAPAMAMPVPPEPEDMPISTSSPTTPTTSTDAFRAAESPSSTPNTRADTNSKAPEYQPPKEVIPTLPPSPAMAMPVPKKPDCESDPNNTPNIDPRFADTDSCGNKKPTEPFKGPPYLPPSAKTMVK